MEPSQARPPSSAQVTTVCLAVTAAAPRTASGGGYPNPVNSPQATLHTKRQVLKSWPPSRINTSRHDPHPGVHACSRLSRGVVEAPVVAATLVVVASVAQPPTPRTTCVWSRGRYASSTHPSVFNQSALGLHRLRPRRTPLTTSPRTFTSVYIQSME